MALLLHVKPMCRLRIMSARFFTPCSSYSQTPLHPGSLPRVPRSINYQLRSLRAPCVGRRAGIVRAFMSSSSALADALRGTESLKAFRLGNSEVRRLVDQAIKDYLTEYLELNPDVFHSILSKSLNGLKAALAAKRARELVMQKSVLRSSSLPGLQVQKSFPPNASYNIQRFKGLGEMIPAQLWETTMDPEKRVLKQLMVEDAAEANVVFSSLMGARVDVRKELIQKSAATISLEQLDICMILPRPMADFFNVVDVTD